MHEYHIVETIVRRVIETAKENRASRVTAVNLVMGEFCGLEESSLRLYFENISCGTLAEGSRLTIKTCGGNLAAPAQASRELYIENIEIESL